jgi:hypothetical protein
MQPYSDLQQQIFSSHNCTRVQCRRHRGISRDSEHMYLSIEHTQNHPVSHSISLIFSIYLTVTVITAQGTVPLQKEPLAKTV